MAATPSVASIKKHFRRLHDPRVVGRTKHLRIDLLVMALCGVIANCDDWPDIALFARQRENWFRRFLRLPGGIPAHDTFEHVFAEDLGAISEPRIAWVPFLLIVPAAFVLAGLVAAVPAWLAGRTRPSVALRAE